MTTDLGIDSLSIGVSTSGMESYQADLRAELLTDTVNKLQEEYQNIMNVINTGWQGVARDRFDTQFQNTCEKIGEDLTAEYNDLEARLAELQAFYFDQDQNLIEE